MKQKLLKMMLLLCALVVGSVSAWADDPTVLFHETFGNNSGSARAWDYSYSVKSGVYEVYSGITGYDVTNVKQGKNTTGSTDSGLNQSSQGVDAVLIIGPLNVASYTSLAVTYQWKAASTKGTYTTKLEYATSSSGSYTEVSGTGAGATSFVERSYSLPAAAQVSTLYLRITWNTSNTQAIIDEVELTGIGASTPPTPTTVATPTFSVPAGAVPRGTDVTISCSTPDATIHYTTDGTAPTSSSPTYSGAITIDADKTIKAIAVKEGLTDSEIASASYTIAKVAAPTFSQAAGEVASGTSVTLSCGTDGATIHYTTDGTDPTSSSPTYSSAITIVDDMTIKAIAVKANYIDSEISEATYTVFVQKNYNLVTDISQIVSGKHYLIASGTSGGASVMGAQKPNNYGENDGISFSGSTLQATGAREFVIQGPDIDGSYTIYDAEADGFLYAASSTSNYLKTHSNIDDNTRFSIEFSGDAAVIKAQGTNSRNTIRYNSGSSLFSCYSSGQDPIYLFVLDGESTPTQDVSVTAARYATFASYNALDFTDSDVKAYIAKANGRTGVTFEQVYKVPARTGVLLYSESGATTEGIPALEDDADDVTDNVFKLGWGSAVKSVVDETKHNYILYNGSQGLGFYQAAGKTVAFGKAYIQIDYNVVGEVKGFIALPGFEDETAINEIVNGQSINGKWYNLVGQRVNKAQKGIFIINGKKVVK